MSVSDEYEAYKAIQKALPKGYWLQRNGSAGTVSVFKVGNPHPMRVLKGKDVALWRNPEKTIQFVVSHAERCSKIDA